MVVTYKTAHLIEWPVFKLPSGNWECTDGLLYIDGLLFDDRNMPGETLGKRRLQSPFDMERLNKSLNTLVGILKQSHKYYIDNFGRCFIYEKTKFCVVKYFPIREVIKKEVASLLWLHKIPFPFTIPRPPLPEFTWAGVLHIDNRPWMLYDYAEGKTKDKRRKV